MIAAPSPPYSTLRVPRFALAFCQAVILIGITAWLITGPRFGPGDVLREAGRPSAGHADQRHGGERFPPEVIRACIANMVMPFEYANGDKIAFLCRLADNRYGIQIVDAASRREITSFYGTLVRMKHILTRDGYTAIVPLP